MLKKGKIGKLEYQIAFEFRSLKWFVLEVSLFSVFLELIYMYFKTKGVESKSDLYFHTFISRGIWENRSCPCIFTYCTSIFTKCYSCRISHHARVSCDGSVSKIPEWRSCSGECTYNS